ncbi:MAG: type II toxin-antitoxin system RelE/ParE family toxin [bacterium]|nr:type II toxin-antitoxin system RelE/ParE family toxin [bacterium]
MLKYKTITHTKAKEFIDSLDKLRRARVDRIYYLFEEYGRFLPSKYLKKLSRDVWELRPGDVRLFLYIKGNTGIMVHGILKKTQKTPKRDLDLAIKRIKDEVK